ncbi:hypothetical protein GCM10028821_51050 [Hymenobacter jeollabukensis]
MVSVVTSHTPATFCIQVPTFDTTEASQMARNMEIASGDQSVAGAGGEEAAVEVDTDIGQHGPAPGAARGNPCVRDLPAPG